MLAFPFLCAVDTGGATVGFEAFEVSHQLLGAFAGEIEGLGGGGLAGCGGGEDGYLLVKEGEGGEDWLG